ncbi:phosphodiester glycosidase family protein [Streptomyces sp. CC208A]|uniref:phosphodiester glycosidase family protein n=1 Tax=Streptomyces sp. CC208A TaxID=3044573 RepID=UPI0024A9B708|nr:phosphodiester glycosidase family protein [Streptomyces sp. CC208A]
MQRTFRSLLAVAAVLSAASAPLAEARPARPATAADHPVHGATRVTSAPASGVTLTSLTYGRQDADHVWTVQVGLPDRPGGPLAGAPLALGPRPTALDVEEALRAGGFEPRVEAVTTPAYADRWPGVLGWTVRTGRYAEEAGAVELAGRLRAAGFTARTRYTAQDGTDDEAPQRVHVLRIDLDAFGGRLEVSHGPALHGTEKLTGLIGAEGAVAGINGQWFYDNAPSGLYVKDGRLLGSATQGRAGIRLEDGGRSFSVDTFTAELTVTAGGETVEVDGVNRLPGRIWNCGGVGGDLPTQRPQHDLRCTDPSELVRFTPEWGAPPAGPGAEAVLDGHGRVAAVRAERGAPVPPGGSTLQATGDSAAWLLRTVRAGSTLLFEERVRDGRGLPVALGPGTTILQVGPALVRDGRVAVNAVGDGVVRDGPDQSFTYDWTVRANPRSMIGVDDRGRLMLVVADGRRPGVSEGLGIDGAARLMRALGAREALNLDGGGSSVLATATGLVNRPSDAAGERALGTGLLLLPPRLR